MPVAETASGVSWLGPRSETLFVQSQRSRSDQEDLSRGDGASQITVDGSFSPVTDDAVWALQTLAGLSVDGIIGPQTWNHLVNGCLAARDPQIATQDVFSSWEASNQVFSPFVSVSSARWALVAGLGSADRNGA